MIAVMARAARAARVASTGGRVISINLTEAGFLVVGRNIVKGQPVRTQSELGLNLFDQRPNMLIEMVGQVDRSLEAAERRAS